MGDQIISCECYFYDGGYCEYYNDECENHLKCNGEA